MTVEHGWGGATTGRRALHVHQGAADAAERRIKLLFCLEREHGDKLKTMTGFTEQWKERETGSWSRMQTARHGGKNQGRTDSVCAYEQIVLICGLFR